MKELRWTAISGIAAIVVVIGMVALLDYQPANSTGAFPTGPTLADTEGICVPVHATGCALPGAPNCCHPSKCIQRISSVYIQQGVCKIKASTA